MGHAPRARRPGREHPSRPPRRGRTGPPPGSRRLARPTVLARPAVLAGSLISLLTACAGPPALAQVELPGGAGRGSPARVAEVVDGDTVDLEFDGSRRERVRLLGVDTPETVKPDAPVECFGPEASARTKAILPAGTAVLVQRDEEARDRYGRLLAYVWRRADGLFVNRSLVAEGYARTLSIDPNTAHRRDLAAASGEARTAGRGLWAACPIEASGPGG